MRSGVSPWSPSACSPSVMGSSAVSTSAVAGQDRVSTTCGRRTPAPPTKNRISARRSKQELRNSASTSGSPDAVPKEQDPQAESAMNTAEVPDASAESGDASRRSEQDRAGSGSAATNDGEPESGACDGQRRSERTGAARCKARRRPPMRASQDAAQKNAANQSNDKSGLLDRMRDAMANLLNKLNMQPKGNELASADGKGFSEKREGPAIGIAEGLAIARAAGLERHANSRISRDNSKVQGDKAQASQGRSGDKNANREPSNDSKSGMGRTTATRAPRKPNSWRPWARSARSSANAPRI